MSEKGMRTWEIQIMTATTEGAVTVEAESIFLAGGPRGSIEVWGHYPEAEERLIASVRRWEIITIEESKGGAVSVTDPEEWATLKAELDPGPDAPTEPAPDLERVGLTVADLDSLQAPPIVTDADGDRWLCKDRRDGAYVWILEDGPTLERTSAGLVKQHGPIRRLL